MADALLQVRGVSKRFGRHRVLDEVSFTVSPGELVALVGENGAGKTSLVRCVAGSTSVDDGEILLEGARPNGTPEQLGVVWQDLALCDNLDVTANLFLGRERGRPLLAEQRMRLEAESLLASLGIHIDDLNRPAGQLSGGQRQGIAIARALLRHPKMLILDEPTSALGVAESLIVDRLVARLRAEGVAILLVSHRLDQVFALADRIVVLRHGRVVADVATREVHPDDIVALITGAATDSAARKQLHQLRSLVDQLSAVQPSASLPLIVSALSAALGVDRLCVHLVEKTGDELNVHLARRAALGLPPDLLDLLEDLELGPAGGLPGVAAERGAPLVVDDLRGSWRSALDGRMVGVGMLSGWAIPIVGATGLLGVVSAYSDRVGTPSDAQLELAGLYANLAASAIERDHLLDEVTRRNRSSDLQRQFLMKLSHELRTPLTAIHGYTSTLRQTDVQWDEASREGFLERISVESARMGRLVGDLLDSSVIESGGLRLQSDWCDLELVLKAAISCIPARPGDVHLEVPEQLPPLWGDHDRLEQVFVNLVDNAMNHGAPPVTVRAVVHSSCVQVDVIDHGRGAPPELADRIFEAHVAGSDSAGAGLGLAIVRGIVEGHLGTIAVLPMLAEGHAIRVELPIEPNSAAAGALGHPAPVATQLSLQPVADWATSN